MTVEKLSPIFLISLPRSGSTVLQQILASSDCISTTSEPWIALPFAYMRKQNGIASEYWHITCSKALDDIVSQFPNKEQDFEALCRDFIFGAYSKLSSPDSRYFLDKTPRYYLITDFLERVFPDAIFIFLFRNPLDVLSSVFNTWHRNSFSPRLRGSIIDLWQGPELLSEAYRSTTATKFRLDYEELVLDPSKALKELNATLQLGLSDVGSKEYQSVMFKGSMGDPTLGKKYQGIEGKSVGAWRGFVTNSYRKAFVKDYVEQMPDLVFETLRMDRSKLLSEIDHISCGMSGSARDLAGYKWMQFAIWAQNLHPWHAGRVLPPRGRRLLPLG